ncbi:TetR/AcrR family transcriptional regulator [Euzebya tangerina]|uniref:TetR/AcrR family transcriptional regulator n=1 Tax=Euzebya tangerina TaxID=591198 RepID=UPI000E310688|nr:TetR/AcrR family transcriptional regulator [Euzebya tangerina]
MVSTSKRDPLSVELLTTTARDLLVEGGPDAVVVREVARRLAVTAPALYKHVAGRDGLLTELIAALLRELTARCAAAAAGVEDPLARLRAAGAAFRDWALANPSEFGLLYGTPIIGYEAPQDGPTTTASRELGHLFTRIFVELDAAGRILVDDLEFLPTSLRTSLEQRAAAGPGDVTAVQLYATAVGWQRLLGLVSVEVAGHLGWAFDEPAEFAAWQLHYLMPDLIDARR